MNKKTNHLIPLFYPPKQNVDRMVEELRDTLSGRWWGQGPKVDEFEKRFGEKFGFKYCVMTNSGTSALHLAYILAGIDQRNSVGVPVLTCTATCHPLKWMKANIVFLDVTKDTLTLDPKYFAIWAESLKAVVHVHLGGVVAHHKKIRSIADKYGVKVIEDACQALGAKNVGYGDYTVFSFQAIKNLSTGDGGMLVVKTEEDYKRAKKLRWFSIDREMKQKKGWQAWDRRGITFDQEEVGFKYQPTDIDASIGLVGLEDFDKNQEHRHRLVRLYRKLLKDCKVVTLLNTKGSADWLFMVLVNMDRDEFASILLKARIETNVAHIRNDAFKVFGGRTDFSPLCNMNEVEKRYICLPLNNQLTEDDVYYICAIIKEIDK